MELDFEWLNVTNVDTLRGPHRVWDDDETFNTIIYILHDVGQTSVLPNPSILCGLSSSVCRIYIFYVMLDMESR